MIEIINASVSMETAYTNKALTRATEKIRKRCDKIRANMFEVAHIIAEVEATGVYKDDYKSVHQWTKEAFGFQKTVSYNLLRIGKEYVREVLDEKGRVVDYETNLLPEGGVADFNLAQVSRMLPAGHELAKDLVDSASIRVEMPSNEIGKIIKAAMQGDTPEEEETLSNDVAEETTESEEFDPGVYSVRMMEENGIVYLYLDIDESGVSREWRIPAEMFDKFEIK